jgi:chromosome segregation ATPase
MSNHHASREDIRELAAANDRVTQVRRELEISEERIQTIRARLRAAELQLSNAIRQITAPDGNPPPA